MSQGRPLRLAVQIFGHLRTYDQCAPFLRKHVLGLYETDVFMHTWDVTEHTGNTWYVNAARSIPVPVDEALKARIQALYHPVSLMVEKQGFFPEMGGYGTNPDKQISLAGMKYMMYAQYQVNQLRLAHQEQTGAQYDYVLAVRPDIMPRVDLDIARYEPEFAYNESASIHLIHEPALKLYGRRYLHLPRMADCFYLAKPAAMNRICAIYERFDYFYRDISATFPAGVDCPEISFFDALIQNGVFPREYRFDAVLKRQDSKFDLQLEPFPSGGQTSKSKFRRLRWWWHDVRHRND